MEYLQSVKNRRVKEWRKLLTKKARDATNTYLVEGFHLVEEAMKTNEVIELMIEEDVTLPAELTNSDVQIFVITKEISAAISDTESPQGIFAVCRKRETATVEIANYQKWLLLDGVQDPGNIGTMIRTADAAGVDIVIFGEGTADLYNPKVIRSAQGSHFHLDVNFGRLTDWIDKIKKADIPVYGTSLQDAIPYKEVSASDSYALIVGNEGSGVSQKILSKTDQNLFIPIYGQSESLNVAIAAGILLYHLHK